jgi:hypothetical protein
MVLQSAGAFARFGIRERTIREAATPERRDIISGFKEHLSVAGLFTFAVESVNQLR